MVNVDLPNIPEDYVHRIGRTGRTGASGIAISFCDAEEKADLRDIQKLINKNIPVVTEHPYVMTYSSQAVQHPAPRPGFQKRAAGNNRNSYGKQRNYRPAYSGR